MKKVQDFYTKESDFSLVNAGFLYGDCVKVSFFVRNQKLIMDEEVYFFLMASMRKMRMNIPLSFTLEFFQEILNEEIQKKQLQNAIINLHIYRDLNSNSPLPKRQVFYYMEHREISDIFEIQGEYEVDVLREIFVNSSLLSNIKTHCPENIYAKIYASDNQLNEIILLNAQKRIARCISGNILLLEEGKIKVPKQSEGAFISPLMENFITFLHKENLAQTTEAEIAGFETQKADEILIISDEKGIFYINKIRNKTFPTQIFRNWIELWKNTF